jgi:hypothetical protein
MSLARRVFSIAGVYGLIVILPFFIGPTRFAQSYPPPVTHPVFYYGFAGTALAWQVAFLIIARDPVRYRPLMLPGILEKLVYGIATAALFMAGEAQPVFLGGAIVDLIFGALFLLAWLKTAPAATATPSART